MGEEERDGTADAEYGDGGGAMGGLLGGNCESSSEVDATEFTHFFITGSKLQNKSIPLHRHLQIVSR